MIVYNFFGGPGSGKSTTAAYVFARLKNKGVRAELAREVAKDFIWEGREVQLSRNQFLVAALQYARLKDLEAHNCEIAVCDSPIVMSLVYSKEVRYIKELRELLYAVNGEFDNVHIFLKRTKPYQKFGRLQEEEQAKELDNEIRKMISYDYEAPGDEQGQESLFQTLWRDYEAVRCDSVG